MPKSKRTVMSWNNVPVRVSGVVIAGAAVLAAPGTHEAASCWHTVPGPAVPAGDSGNLVGVSMPGPASGWAVGFTLPDSPRGNFHPLLARWDGRRWQATRPPAGIGAGRLDGIAALSASNAWAVGAAIDASNDSTPLIIHWNGHRWARVRAAPVPGYADTELLGVAATSSSNAWAVGEAENTAMRLRTMTEHWNGRTWTLVPSPSAGTQSALSGVAAIHGQAWAVGGSFARTSRPFVLHWTGHAWQRVATPRASNVELDGVAVVIPNQVWAVGAIFRNGLRRPYALRWDGGAWRSVPVPPGPARLGRELTSVTGLGGGGRLAAVGDTLGPATTGALHAGWNGRRWSVTPGPLNGTSLAAVTTDGHTLWAVGAQDQSASRFVPLVQTCRQ
jgi:hypothetical protein